VDHLTTITTASNSNYLQALRRKCEVDTIFHSYLLGWIRSQG